MFEQNEFLQRHLAKSKYASKHAASTSILL